MHGFGDGKRGGTPVAVLTLRLGPEYGAEGQKVFRTEQGSFAPRPHEPLLVTGRLLLGIDDLTRAPGFKGGGAVAGFAEDAAAQGDKGRTRAAELAIVKCAQFGRYQLDRDACLNRNRVFRLDLNCGARGVIRSVDQIKTARRIGIIAGDSQCADPVGNRHANTRGVGLDP